MPGPASTQLAIYCAWHLRGRRGAAVGYAAHGLLGALLAALIVYTPSFAFIVIGASSFERLLENRHVLAFLAGAAPAAAGAIIGAAISLTEAIAHTWQYFVLAAAAVALLALRCGVVQTLLARRCRGCCGGAARRAGLLLTKEHRTRICPVAFCVTVP